MADEVYHCIPHDETAERLGTQIEKGLSSKEVEKRVKEHGHNELTEKPRPGFLKMLLDQFNNFLIIILIIAALVSLLLVSKLPLLLGLPVLVGGDACVLAMAASKVHYRWQPKSWQPLLWDG